MQQNANAQPIIRQNPQANQANRASPAQGAQAHRRPPGPPANRPGHRYLSNDSDDSDDEEGSGGRMQNLMMMNRVIQDPYLRQLLAQLMVRGGGRESHEHIDVFDPQAMEKLQKMQLPEDGLLPFQIDSIIPYEYKKTSKEDACVECNICLVDFEDGAMVKRLQCLHLYHQKCIDEWLAKRSVCPDCKFNLRALDIEQLL